jgi:hypothetical protein
VILQRNRSLGILVEQALFFLKASATRVSKGILIALI